MRPFVFLTVLALSNPAQAEEYILCVKDFTLSLAVGVKRVTTGKMNMSTQQANTFMKYLMAGQYGDTHKLVKKTD